MIKRKKKLTWTRTWVLRVHLRVHVRRGVQRLQVHVLRLGQHLQKRRLAVKRVHPLRAQQTHSEARVSDSRFVGQDVRPRRQSLQRPPRRDRRRFLVEAEQLLDAEAGASLRRGGHLPDRGLQLRSGVKTEWSNSLLIFRVWKDGLLFARHAPSVLYLLK